MAPMEVRPTRGAENKIYISLGAMEEWFDNKIDIALPLSFLFYKIKLPESMTNFYNIHV